jgi:TonB-dependent SusC/RagA subfamily outer membrane receptor
MIQGTVPGVDVYGKTIRIRGVNFQTSNNGPIFVIDGIISNTIDHITPNSVQSITVLKNEETALYGSRGTGGVIVITLKKIR